MASSPPKTTAPPDLTDLSLTNTIASSNEQQNQKPVLPLEVLRQIITTSLDQFCNVVDLASIAMVCRDWRELINGCDACWKKAFIRDHYLTYRYCAEDYAKLLTWRQKYIACTLDLTYWDLRKEGRRVNELEETVMFLHEKIKIEEGNERPTERFQRALDEHFAILESAYGKVEGLQKKRDSLQAATKYISRHMRSG